MFKNFLLFIISVGVATFFSGCVSATIGIDTRQNSGCSDCNKQQYIPVPYPAYMPPPQQQYYDGF